MSVVIVFILVVIGFSTWWLLRQGLMTKPWLEVGADPAGGGRPTMPTEKIALGVFLAVVGALFALFASAYFMRQEFVDWQAMPLPRIVWLNTGMLVLASVALQCALAAVRQGDADTVRLSLVTGAVASVGFLAGQLVAWRELDFGGYTVTEGPASSFFYLLTALHGLHIVGGLVALARTLPGAWGVGPPDRLRLRIELCTGYWHFLLLVWLGLLTLFTGRAAEFIDICRQLLS
jgi:cytochrome c oxidase subunit III